MTPSLPSHAPIAEDRGCSSAWLPAWLASTAAAHGLRLTPADRESCPLSRVPIYHEAMTTPRAAVSAISPPHLDCGDWILRAWMPGDAVSVLSACQDSEIQKWTRVPSPYTIEHALSFVGAHATSELSRRSGVPLAIVDKAAPEAVGSVSLSDIDWSNSAAVIGYWIAPAARRRGAATGAVTALTCWAHDVLAINRTEAPILVGNVASQAVIKRAGYSFEGIRRGAISLQGEFRDLAIFAHVASRH